MQAAWAGHLQRFKRIFQAGFAVVADAVVIESTLAHVLVVSKSETRGQVGSSIGFRHLFPCLLSQVGRSLLCGICSKAAQT